MSSGRFLSVGLVAVGALMPQMAPTVVRCWRDALPGGGERRHVGLRSRAGWATLQRATCQCVARSPQIFFKRASRPQLNR